MMFLFSDAVYDKYKIFNLNKSTHFFCYIGNEYIPHSKFDMAIHHAHDGIISERKVDENLHNAE